MPRYGRTRWAKRRTAANLTTAREAFRVLRSNLAVSIAEVDNPCILVTSAAESEGKTSTCVALAESLAAVGSRVVVVDLDLRVPGVHCILGAHNEYGVSDVLQGHRSVEQCLQRIQFLPDPNLPATGMYLLAAGPTVANPTELLSEPRLGRLLDGLAGVADIVFLDSPPVLAVADTLVIGRLAAGAVLVVKAGETPTPTVRRAKDALTRSQVRLLGVVLNKFDTRFAGEDYDANLGYGAVSSIAPPEVLDAPTRRPVPAGPPPTPLPPVIAVPPAAVPAGPPIGSGPRRRRRWWPFAAVAGLVLAGGLGVGVAVAARDDDDGAIQPTAATPSTTTTTTSPSTTEILTDPEDATTRQDGRGDAVIPIDRPDGPQRPTIVYATHRGGRGLVLTAGDTTLVDAAGPYEGSTLLLDEDVAELQIRTDGDWHIELRSTRLAKQWDGSAKIGRGDQVLAYEGDGGALALQSAARGPFVVTTVSPEGDHRTQLVSTTGPYQGSVPIDAGPLLLVIEADGADWGATAN